MIAGLVVFLSLVTLLGEWLLVWLQNSRDWSYDSALAIRLSMIMLPYMPIVCAIAMAGALLQVHRRFGPQAFAPILLNLTMIAATFLATLGLDLEASREAIAIRPSSSVLI